MVQRHGSKKQGAPALDPFRAEASAISGADIDEMRERLFRKFMRLKQRLEAERLAQGGSMTSGTASWYRPGG